MSAHAIGALAVVGLALLLNGPWRCAWLLLAGMAALGYLAFLLSSQTRGVWLALLASLMMMLTAVPWRSDSAYCSVCYWRRLPSRSMTCIS